MGKAELSLEIPNELKHLERVNEALAEFARAHKISDNTLFDLNLALDETLVNTISYGYKDDDDHDHRIRIGISLAEDIVTLTTEDDAAAFNPLDTPPPNLDLPIEERPIGGLGIFLIKSMMDSVDYRRERNKNILTMRKTAAIDD